MVSSPSLIVTPFPQLHAAGFGALYGCHDKIVHIIPDDLLDFGADFRMSLQEFLCPLLTLADPLSLV